MKKIYMQPCIECMEEETVEMIAASGVGSEEMGIEYGGVDDGTNEPAVRGLIFGDMDF